MTKKHPTHFLILCTAIFLLAACTGNNKSGIEYVVVTATLSAPTNTPDPCAPENLQAEVMKIHNHIREYDDEASLAGSILQGINKGQMKMSDLSNTIPNLQRIRREAEDQPTPPCLINLKTYQINYMYAVINSLNAFLSGNQQSFEQNFRAAPQQHDLYSVELARLLGQTIVSLPPAPPPQPSATAKP